MGPFGDSQALSKRRKAEAARPGQGHLPTGLHLQPHGDGGGGVKEELGQQEALLLAIDGRRAALVRGVVDTAAWGWGWRWGNPPSSSGSCWRGRVAISELVVWVSRRVMEVGEERSSGRSRVVSGLGF